MNRCFLRLLLFLRARPTCPDSRNFHIVFKPGERACRSISHAHTCQLSLSRPRNQMILDAIRGGLPVNQVNDDFLGPRWGLCPVMMVGVYRARENMPDPKFKQRLIRIRKKSPSEKNLWKILGSSHEINRYGRP
ncbi:hypothetical protein DFS33DRAFT_230161 [Desarmillaria ectypa]|nr:hypothetical protein DFS33DRAFT_230161 [Desarmillaria ectypa]